MSELDKATIDFITDPNELRFHAENPIEEDGRIHVTPELLFAVADKIDGLRAELARRDEIIKRLKLAGNNMYFTCSDDPYQVVNRVHDAWRALMKELK